MRPGNPLEKKRIAKGGTRAPPFALRPADKRGSLSPTPEFGLKKTCASAGEILDLSLKAMDHQQKRGKCRDVAKNRVPGDPVGKIIKERASHTIYCMHPGEISPTWRQYMVFCPIPKNSVQDLSSKRVFYLVRTHSPVFGFRWEPVSLTTCGRRHVGGWGRRTDNRRCSALRPGRPSLIIRWALRTVAMGGQALIPSLAL